MSDGLSWSKLVNEPAALAALAEYGLSEQAEAGLLKYCLLLKEFNSHTNLVGRAELAVLLKEHVLDALKLLPFIAASPGARLIDVGSGAGFPGMVLAIAGADLQVVLLDSIAKKCRFLTEAVSSLSLQDRVRVVCQRAEVLAHQNNERESYDFATARAVGALPMVAEFCLPFLKQGGLLLLQRSRKQADAEEAFAESVLAKFGGELRELVDFKPDLLEREMSLLVVEKKHKTKSAYPRSAARIKKELESFGRVQPQK